MNYQLIYDKIIMKAKIRLPLNEQYENHHIVLRSHGGNDRASNIVELTLKEHRIAHLLLVRLYNDRSTAWAAKMMCNRTDKKVPQFVKTLLTQSDTTKAKIAISLLGNNNGAGNKGLKRSEQGKINMSKAAIGKVLSPESIAKREATKNANNSHKGGRPVGYVVSQETKDKIAFANKGMKRSEESKLKMSQSAQNRKRI